jgi:hypothetical protein
VTTLVSSLSAVAFLIDNNVNLAFASKNMKVVVVAEEVAAIMVEEPTAAMVAVVPIILLHRRQQQKKLHLSRLHPLNKHFLMVRHQMPMVFVLRYQRIVEEQRLTPAVQAAAQLHLQYLVRIQAATVPPMVAAAQLHL